ncbi:SUMF1/EgtB/PvdO family nonheme iron enzyme [Ramlibacter sp. AN1015]|uniref:SUMF1/EgtB/PvdO family nonheme iron enzyme n=1 Tax=Ramlibacter sp. AN1015 TaxID=3133428 RepID=UPI0030C087EA
MPLPPAAIDTPTMRCAGRELLSLALMDARNHTLQLLGVWEQAVIDGIAPPEGEAAQARWIAGHVGWLAEWWLLRLPELAPGETGAALRERRTAGLPGADAVFDIRHMAAAPRSPGLLPDASATRGWLLATLDRTLELLSDAEEGDEDLELHRAALFHEDARSEQLLVLAQQAGLRLPVAAPEPAGLRDALWMPALRWRMGYDGPGFAFPLERPAHEVAVPEFEIDAQPVTWSQYVEFVADGGYDRPELWRPAGWAWLQQEGRRAPRHVEEIGVRSGAVLQSWFGVPLRRAGGQAVMHVSWWEADAWARWAGRRLPTEAEWEVAAHLAAQRGFRWGEVHEWTLDLLRPWDGYVAPAWADGTLFDPTPGWGRARVRRAASLATRARMKHPKARAFAMPEHDQDFVGFRTCAL